MLFVLLLLRLAARIVECLFLNGSQILYETSEWRVLCRERSGFLTLDLCDKYLSDACGLKGLKRLRKYTLTPPPPAPADSGSASATAAALKYAEEVRKRNKLFYIVFRLLGMAECVLDSAAAHAQPQLTVWHAPGSALRDFIMAVRRGDTYTYEELLTQAEASVTRIEAKMQVSNAFIHIHTYLPHSQPLAFCWLCADACCVCGWVVLSRVLCRLICPLCLTPFSMIGWWRCATSSSSIHALRCLQSCTHSAHRRLTPPPPPPPLPCLRLQ